MSRVAAFASLVLFAFPSAALAQQSEPAADAVVQLAALKPSLPAVPSLAEPTALHPADPEPRPPLHNLAARMAAAPRLMVKVSLSTQTMEVWLDGQETRTWKVSTAGKGYITPKGVWKPYRMHTMWHSRKYDNAPMPHSIFYSGGFAIHATPHIKRLGRPASHGCVRLHPDHARELFAMAQEVGRERMRVIVQD
ncbi:L,D-transpeptidase [Chthonobacter albigriseus]|uniref:L,D-transpeptidase n=1 Tax=Chthonobacter albigriseus TaxID=1683161 RepID=UPI001FCEC78C|nr:L,D-transpeptidase [Chthonobacter albigriseus]